MTATAKCPDCGRVLGPDSNARNSLRRIQEKVTRLERNRGPYMGHIAERLNGIDRQLWKAILMVETGLPRDEVARIRALDNPEDAEVDHA